MSKVGDFLRWLVALFKNITAKTKELTPEIIQIVTNIKNFVDSPGCDFLTAVIPGTLDDSVQKILKTYLPLLLDILNKVPEIAEILDPNERQKAIVLSIQQDHTDAKAILLNGIAGQLLAKATGTPYAETSIIAPASYQFPKLAA
jgi:hypothetical protein